MNIRMRHFFIAGVFALAFALGISTRMAQGTTHDPAVPQQRHEAFEDLHHAQDLLNNARSVLAAAPGSFGGHRENAIKKVNEALSEVNKAFEYKEHH